MSGIQPPLVVLEKRTSTTCRALAALMAEHPVLVQRPIAERGDRAGLARPPEPVLELLTG